MKAHLCPGGKAALVATSAGLDKFLNLPTGSANTQVTKVKSLLADAENHLIFVSAKEVPGLPAQNPSAGLPPKYAYLKPLLDNLQGVTLLGKATEDLALTVTAAFADDAKAKEALAAAKKGAGELNTFQNKAAITAASVALGQQGKALGLANDLLGQLKPVQEGNTVKQSLSLKGTRIKSVLPAAQGGGQPGRPSSGGFVPGAVKPPAGGGPFWFLLFGSATRSGRRVCLRRIFGRFRRHGASSAKCSPTGCWPGRAETSGIGAVKYRE